MFTIALTSRCPSIHPSNLHSCFRSSVKVSTRVSEHVFSVFLNINETFKLMEQLANIAMRQLLDNKGFEQDRSLPKLKRKTPKKVSALKR